MGSQAVSQDPKNFHGEMQDVISALKEFSCCFIETRQMHFGNRRSRENLPFRQHKIMNETTEVSTESHHRMGH